MFASARRLVRTGLFLFGFLAIVTGIALPGGRASAAAEPELVFLPDLVLQAKFGNVLEITNAGNRATASGFVVRVENLTQRGTFFEKVSQVLAPGQSVDISFFACP